MRFGMIGDNPIEKAALASGLLPTPMIESYAMVTTRALLAAARAGLFEAIGGGTATAGDLSARCGPGAQSATAPRPSVGPQRTSARRESQAPEWARRRLRQNKDSDGP